MGALGDVARDFVEVELHHVGVGVGQRQGRPDAPGWADRAEQIGVVVALVGGLPWAASRAWPIAEQGRSSGRSGPRLYMRVLLSSVRKLSAVERPTKGAFRIGDRCIRSERCITLHTVRSPGGRDGP